MQFTLDTDNTAFRISAYGEGFIVINDERLEHSLIVTPGSLHRDWRPADIDSLGVEHMERIAALEPEIVLLGTGRSQHFPPAHLLAPMANRGIGLEIMHTAAACRTYNVLMAESRRVAAALFMI